MKIAVVGFGMEGLSTYKYFSAMGGNDIVIHDQNPNLQVPEGAKTVIGDNYLDNLAGYDVVIRTSGLPPAIILDKNPGIADKITTQLNIFLRVCPTLNLIGVTGTKGKGTTSTLIAKMLEASGRHVVLAGNIGVPMLDVLASIKVDSYVVLELSSFQLIDLREASPRIAVCLMVTPEHLNWHSDIDEYAASKANLFSHQSPGDKAIFYAGNDFSRQIASATPGELIPYFTPPGAYIEDDRILIDGTEICFVNEVKLMGKHNLQNVCAAITAVWQVDRRPNAVKYVLTTFSGLEHRLEFVRELAGVSYYDDSFGTTPEAAQVAIEAFEQPIVLIAGGSSKGSDYTPMVDSIIKNDVRFVVCIGDTGRDIARMLENRKNEREVPYTLLTGSSDSLNMYDIVDAARSKAEAGSVVLLATGSASFGLFNNYKERGELFKTTVMNLNQS